MSDAGSSGFVTGADAWLRGLGSVRDVVRQGLGSVRDVVREGLVSRQLAAHLPKAGGRLRVLDAGCGQGTQAIVLARLGHEVLGIDNSEQMLARARSLAEAEPAPVSSRLRFELGDALEARTVTGEGFDVVCCHGVAMYLPSLPELVRALLSAAALAARPRR